MRSVVLALAVSASASVSSRVNFRHADGTMCALGLSGATTIDVNGTSHHVLESTCSLSLPADGGIGKKVSLLQSDSSKVRKRLDDVEARATDDSLKFIDSNSSACTITKNAGGLSSDCSLNVPTDGGIGEKIKNIEDMIVDMTSEIFQLKVSQQHPCDALTHSCDTAAGVCFSDFVSAGDSVGPNATAVDTKHMRDKLIQYHCGCKLGYEWSNAADATDTTCFATAAPTASPTSHPTVSPTASPTKSCFQPDSGNLVLGGHQADQRQAPHGWTYSRCEPIPY
jgi:hypothetical protein